MSVLPARVTFSVSMPVLCLLLSLGVSPVLADGLRLAGDRLFVPVVVNGTATEALLDSGAEMTLVDAGFARRLDLALQGSETARGTGGEQEVRFASGVDIESTGTRLDDLTVAVLDLSDISERLVGEPVRLVLGRDLFDAGRFLLDIRNGRFRRVDDSHRPQGVRLSLTDHAGIKQIPVEIEGVPALADFDLGNGSEMLIGRKFAAANGWLTPGRLLGTREGGGLGGAVERDLLRLDALSLAGKRFTDITAAVDDTANAAQANVGVDVLEHFLMTIDFPRNAVWLETYDAVEEP